MSDQSFDELINLVRPQCDAFEATRATYKRQVIRILVIMILVAGTGFFFFFNNPLIYGICAVVVILIVFAIVSKIRSSRLTAYYKSEVVPRIVSYICPESTYSPGEGISYNLFVQSNLFIPPDRYSSEDLIEGQIGLTRFHFAEVHAEERVETHTRQGSTTVTRTTWRDIFRGFLFIADFNKDFNGQTTLKPKTLLGGLIGRKQRVTLENEAFMELFDVRSTDQIEARYLLSPSLMERFVALAEKYGRCLSISFTQSYIIVAIPDYADHYEASIWRSIFHNNALKRDIWSVHNLTSIVEELNMNTRIWSKA